jgi:ribosomal protein S18 acetylase RimI-like enzyme
MNNIVIRESKIEDIDNGILEVFIDGYNFHKKGRPDIFLDMNKDELRKELCNKFDAENLNLIVILEDDKIVGYTEYVIKERAKKKIDIQEIAIIKKCRGKGYGKKLINKVIEIGKHEKCDRIELNCWMFNKNGLDFYRHLGFDEQRIIFEMKL